jgi:2',3'-cyclic-nucleotide 3'-phosphodiesterase
MPGASLWLLPPAGASQDPLFALIEKTSSHFGSPHRFLPHITLTSELSPNTYGQNPQAWLDALDFDKAEVQVKFEKLDSENVFVRKLYVKCEKTQGLKQLAMHCRQEVEGFADTSKATNWAEESYNPHLSLL